MGGWMLLRYDDVKAVIRDPARSSSVKAEARRRGVNPPREGVAGIDPPTLLSTDPPDHTRLRRLLDKEFTPRTIAKLEPYVRDIAAELLRDAVAEGRIDVIDDLAIPLPVIVIAELLGVPRDQRELFKRWSSAVTDPARPDQDPEEQAERDALRLEAIVEFREYLREAIVQRRGQPTDDFIGQLVAARDGDDALTERELLAFVSLLLVAGNETTTNLIGNAVLALHRHPHQLRLPRERPELIDTAVEEFLRYEGPMQNTSRVLTEPVTLHGIELAPRDTEAACPLEQLPFGSNFNPRGLAHSPARSAEGGAAA